MLKFTSSLLLLFLMGPSFAMACEVLEGRMTLTELFVSEKTGISTVRTSGLNGSFNGLTISNCKGGFIQLALGALLPHPQNYSGMLFRSSDLPRTPVCTIQTASGTQDLEFQSAARRHVQLSKECVGLYVADPSHTKLQLLNNNQCVVVSHNENFSQMTLKGDNCVLKPSPAGFQASPVVLNNCRNFLSSAEVKEVDMNLSVQFANSLNSNTSPDGLAAKPIRLSISSDQGNIPVSLSKKALKKFPYYASSEYRLRFDVADLKLIGTTETGLSAEVKYSIDRNANLPGNLYRVPFVVKNELYLAKAGSSSEFLAGWYNGSILPARWSGQDGAASFNRLLDTPAPGKLNSTARQIHKGDQIVLISRIGNPNSSTRQFGRYLKSLLLLQKAKKPLTSNVVIGGTSKDQKTLPTLQSLETISPLAGLPTLSGLSDLNNQLVQELTDWPTRFDSICINDHCAKSEEISDGFEIQSVFKVEESDFEVQLRLRQQLVKWNGKAEPIEEKQLLNQVQCQ